MKAIVFHPSGPRLEERPVPVAGQNELLLKVEYCGICGSDIHAGEPDFHPGTIMGHEFSATVVDLGPGATGFAVGDRVVVHPNAQVCGECEECRRGLTNLCAGVWKTATGLVRDGGLASFTTAKTGSTHKLPDSVDFATAALVEPLAVALHAVRRSGFAIGQTAVVLGAGPIGLLVTTLLAAAGASEITVVEPSPTRRKYALQQGAQYVIDPNAVDTVDHFDQAGQPDYVFECSGVAELVGIAIRIVRKRGVVTVSGFSRRPPQFAAADLLHKEVSLMGSFIYTHEFAEAISLLASGKIDARPLISGIVSLDEGLDAFAKMKSSPDVVKLLIRASHDGEQDTV
ncbi:zinc-dependent alcohol dehydrogenase [Gulosibacter chungangensis]|uniref:Alcohol dehydrogenase catalytic domain-containing protein n=1 Tax=Gulosibacter chungangensis TaxID=979746 RepID=A0A7J5BA53_9MICO|nr:zinc-binding dehydrogenase [Gulosibacter chungangensis]KAB1642703.1 alcohol dehydrogenase catalytic domain-containing protein [Gulosibacter chungangensis]